MHEAKRQQIFHRNNLCETKLAILRGKKATAQCSSLGKLHVGMTGLFNVLTPDRAYQCSYAARSLLSCMYFVRSDV